EKPSEKDKERWADEAENLAKGVDVQTHRDPKVIEVQYEDGTKETLSDGDVVISAITSCTNTSNPFVMIAAGILAKKAVERGLKVPRKVKTSLAPGSRVVTDYLTKAGLLDYLDKLGYSLVGYGCTTCIGNSGPLPLPIEKGIKEGNIATSSVLSGNRNFEARIHPDVSANYLMSPPLVIAFGIAGTVIKDLTSEPLGTDNSGRQVFLKDIWPTNKEVLEVVKSAVSTGMFEDEYSRIFGVNKHWDALEYPKGSTYSWDGESTYIQNPPFFDGFDPKAEHRIAAIKDAYILGVFGDSLSTDHISPAGAIGQDSVAGKYLMSKSVGISDFNTFGSRRGNHEVMMRGTFANVKIKNLMLDGKVGGSTIYVSDKSEMSIYDAAMRYKEAGKPLVVIGGIEYGSGSSRDWAAKGPMLLGVKAIIAKSFERIHRSNLVGLGILPIEFMPGEGYKELSIDPMKPISIDIDDNVKPRSEVKIRYFSAADMLEHETKGRVRLDSELDVRYYKMGGVLNYVLDKLVRKAGN
ncbi:aconitate hydratase 1, partial [mine drainage metagenome]